MIKRIVGLREIAGQFDLYLVDQYGVLHDGVATYPDRHSPIVVRTGATALLR